MPSTEPKEKLVTREGQNEKRRSATLKRTDLRVFAIFVLVSLGAWAVWMHRWQAQVARRDEMYALYATASGGDRESVRRLAEYPSSEAMQLIEKLAQDRNAFPEGRVEAINVLSARPPIHSKTLAPLLRIDQPFVIRHATAEAFEQRGCDDQCILSTLYALHAIWKVEPAIEAARSTEELEQRYGVHIPPEEKAKINAELRGKTEQDYWKLLGSNPCATRKALIKDYSAEPAFGEHVQSKVGPC
jgi:hypothetical protein